MLHFVVTTCFIVVFAMNPAQAEDCAAADNLTQQAQSLPLAQRIALYQSARSACPSEPTMHYREGMALMAAGLYAPAHAALTEALNGVTRLDSSPKMRLDVLGRLAEIEYRQDHRPQALSGFKVARTYAQAHQLQLPVWLTLLQKDMDRQLDERPLTGSEMKSSLKGMRDLGVEPVVDYRILFDTDSDHLRAEAEQQLARIADSFQDVGHIQVIGHTDLRGTAQHNQNLSERRARRVVNWLEAHIPSLAGRLSAQGLGMSEPKYFGDSDEDHQMNRRVEFVFDTR